MFFTFTPPQVYSSTEYCKVSKSQLTFQLQPQRSGSEIAMPSTPFQTTITLPPVSSTPPAPCGTHGLSRDEFYPISLSQNSTLSVSKMTDLLSIEMFSPIHVHTPLFHIGTLHPVPSIPATETTALETTLYLQSITQMPMSIHTYLRLPQVLRIKVKQAYQKRVGVINTNSEDDVWNRFISGKDVEQTGPFVCDLFLEVWGFERSVYGSYSIVHVA